MAGAPLRGQANTNTTRDNTKDDSNNNNNNHNTHDDIHNTSNAATTIRGPKAIAYHSLGVEQDFLTAYEKAAIILSVL